MNNRETGARKESQAAEYLRRHGMKIIEKNFQNSRGEIDLIGRHEGYLVFVEVKYRRSAVKGYASEAVDRRKQRRICRAADYYRYTHGLGDDTGVRYDVIAIQGDNIQWIKNAFPHVTVN